jgi:hypothetical protein
MCQRRGDAQDSVKAQPAGPSARAWPARAPGKPAALPAPPTRQGNLAASPAPPTRHVTSLTLRVVSGSRGGVFVLAFVAPQWPKVAATTPREVWLGTVLA